jgi:hypothetical protein
VPTKEAKIFCPTARASNREYACRTYWTPVYNGVGCATTSSSKHAARPHQKRRFIHQQPDVWSTCDQGGRSLVVRSERGRGWVLGLGRLADVDVIGAPGIIL